MVNVGSLQMQIYNYRFYYNIAVNDQAYNICYTLCKAAYYNNYFIVFAAPENNSIS